MNRVVTPSSIAPPAARYAHAVLSEAPARLLHISGQVPVAPDGTIPTDIGDQAVADLIADLGEAEVTRDLGELRALEAALKRVADGGYGLCVDCGDDIPYPRMHAQPAAERCLACQERHERTYRA